MIDTRSRRKAAWAAALIACGVTGAAAALGFTARAADARQEPKAAQATATQKPVPAEKAEIDQPVRDFAFRNILAEDAKNATIKLSDYKGKKAVIAVFMANRCGTTWTYEKKIGNLIKDYKNKDVAILAIHSNYQETDAEIKGQLEQRNLIVPLLDDKKDQAFVRYIGAAVTPTFLVIDKNGILRYQGSFDQRRDESKTYVRNAVDAVLANKPVEVKSTRAFG